MYKLAVDVIWYSHIQYVLLSGHFFYAFTVCKGKTEVLVQRVLAVFELELTMDDFGHRTSNQHGDYSDAEQIWQKYLRT